MTAVLILPLSAKEEALIQLSRSVDNSELPAAPKAVWGLVRIPTKDHFWALSMSRVGWRNLQETKRVWRVVYVLHVRVVMPPR